MEHFFVSEVLEKIYYKYQLKMTFEEFKKELKEHSKKFGSKLLSEEELRVRYKRELISKEDSNYLIPVNLDVFKNNGTSLHDSYYFRLNEYLHFDRVKEGEVVVLVLASFKSEFLVRFKDDELKKCGLSESLWENLYNQKFIKPKYIESMIEVDISHVQSLQKQITEMILTAKIPSSQSVVLDGVKYYFFTRDKNIIKCASAHSPEDNSKIGILLNYLHEVIDD